jgi:hypothetical protein
MAAGRRSIAVSTVRRFATTGHESERHLDNDEHVNTNAHTIH